jgi:hypothetical protein
MRLAGVALVLGVAACGGSAPEPPKPAPSYAEAPPDAAAPVACEPMGPDEVNGALKAIDRAEGPKYPQPGCCYIWCQQHDPRCAECMHLL